MKKPVIIGSVITAALFAAPYAFAQTSIQPCSTDQHFSLLCNASLSGAFGGLITAAFVIAILIALAYLIYGGIRWILSQGDKGKVDSARQHIIASLIGLIVVFLSYFLLNIVTNLFFGSNIQGLTNIPRINLAGTCSPGTNCTSGQICTDNTCTCGTGASQHISPVKNSTCNGDGTFATPTPGGTN